MSANDIASSTVELEAYQIGRKDRVFFFDVSRIYRFNTHVDVIFEGKKIKNKKKQVQSNWVFLRMMYPKR